MTGSAMSSATTDDARAQSAAMNKGPPGVLQQVKPEPLVAPEVDLRDFSFMPLDVLRLRDSELAGHPDPEVFRSNVLSWCVAWHQIPAATLPDDDVTLARLLGFGRDIKGWKRIRASGGLRGWVSCSDGRLHHPVVADKAREAWRGKLMQRWRTEAARIKKHNQRHKLDGEAAVSVPEFEDWLSLGCPQGQALHVPEDKDPSPRKVPEETPSKGQREGQGQGQGQGDLIVSPAEPAEPPKPPAPPPPEPPPAPPAAVAAATTRGSRLSRDWLLPKHWGEWALADSPHWTPDIVRRIAENFRDYWVAKSGKDATKTDWEATWRNWCRSDLTQRQFGPARPGSAPPIDTEARNDEARRLLGFKTRGRPAAASADPAQPTRSVPPLLIAATDESPS
jgi:hypothetical protein